MKPWKRVGDGLAIVALISALAGVGMTLLGLQARDWQWSGAMLALASVMSGFTIFCIALCFRDPARSRFVHGAIALVGVNLLLYIVFDRALSAF